MLIIGFSGLLGVFARYSIVEWISSKSFSFPYHTLVVNLIGCFMAGLLFGFQERSQLISPDLARALSIGFLGGFTTFSALCVDSFVLIQNRSWILAFLNICGSPILGVIAFYIGRFIILRWVGIG